MYASLAQDLDCVNLGLKKIEGIQNDVQLRLVLASDYEQDGKFDSARDAYLGVLSLDPQNSDAYNGFTRSLAKTTDPYTQVTALENLGMHAEARTLLIKIAEENPSLPIPPQLRYMMPLRPVPYWLSPGWLGQIIRPYLDAAFMFILLVLLMVALRVRIFPWIRNALVLSLDIRDFDKAGTDLDFGKGLATLVRQEYRRIEKLADLGRIDVVSGSVSDFTMPDFIESLGGPGKWAAQVAAWVLPRKLLTVSGCGHATAKDKGISLVLTRPNQDIIGEMETIWLTTFHPAGVHGSNNEYDDFIELTTPAAIWLLFNVHLRGAR